MAKQGFKYELFSQFARVGKALSNANRLEILEFLGQAERNVEELAHLSNLSVANTSQHLQLLRQTGLIKCRKQGLKVYYSLSDDDVIEMLSSLRNVAERHLAEVDQLIDTYLTVKDSLEPINADELLQRAKDGLVSILDVRPEHEYQSGHIRGAINVPIDQLEDHLTELDQSKEIIAYCRGPHCILSFDAVEQLRKKGFQIRRFEEGFPEWKLAGHPVEK